MLLINLNGNKYMGGIIGASQSMLQSNQVKEKYTISFTL